ncbi:ABC transporter permease [Bosea sp. BIWAKO-01]|uniref:ABC transporter permease n=1 Tax=Bosea sp. BIWAKO-01 TaxID=506668 RepID=UPI000853A6E4|nr:ABC transporter permease [Bosea sp. BIWAKO-01]GAU86078.1 dipeptide transport system permease protein DppB [Bosea sp. BIWAKO-01]
MMKMIASRLVFMIVAGLLLLTFLFCLFHAIPGDPARLIAGDSAPEELVASIRTAYGLDQPLGAQYVAYMGKVLTGDFGVSNFSRQPVLAIVGPRLLNTALLAAWAMLFATTISLVLGSLSAMYWSRPIDRGVSLVSLIGICTPIFVSGIVAIYFFGVYLRWLPIGGMTTWRHFIMPVLTLGFAQAAGFTRMVRACMIDALQRDFIVTARSKGVPERTIVFKHALRNALLPIITFFGLGLGSMLGGAAVAESIFNWPGLGRLMVDSILTRDLPLTQGCIFVFAMMFVLVNLIVDLLYRWADPRLAHD